MITNYKKLFFILITLVFLFTLTFSSLAIGISANPLFPVIYQPGEIIVNHYQLSNAEEGYVKVFLSENAPDYVKLTPLENNGFDLIIQFPANIPSVGTYAFTVTAQELLKDKAQMVGLTAAAKAIKIEVYSNQKDIVASLNVPNFNEEEIGSLKLDINSKTYQDINSVRAEISIIDNNSGKEISKIKTEEKYLETLSAVSFDATFDPLTNGDYSAKAIVYFDGNIKEFESNFKVGTEDVKLIKYPNEIPLGFSEFVITIENGWGNNINNVYGTLSINGEDIFQTPSVNLAPWQTTELKSIVEIKLAQGEYNGIIELHFGDKIKEENVKIKVVEKLEGKIDIINDDSAFNLINLSLVVGIIVLGLIIVLIVAVIKKKILWNKDEI